MYKQVSSFQNPFVKQMLQLLEKSRERRKSGLFVIEGQREIDLAIKGGYKIDSLLFSSEIIEATKISEVVENLSDTTEIIEVTKEVYQKLAYRSSTEGILAVAKTKDLILEKLELSTKNPLILVAEAPEKPGNIGALLRTADAANLDAVIIANPKTDIYNPNILRSSVGCVFTNKIAVGTTQEIITYLKKNNVSIYSAILQDAVSYDSQDFTKASAFVVGTEATGLSQEWRQSSKQNIIIPMQGAIDSMNVSVAAGVLIFEAKRQRNFK